MNHQNKPTTLTKGKKAEDLSENHLVELGFEIIERNYRNRRSEIDLIALKDNLLLFVEVKFRKGNAYGFPEEFVSKNQERSIIQGADQYISDINWQGNIRFDIIAINSDYKIHHFEDAFY